jgi:hypothetical protein
MLASSESNSGNTDAWVVLVNPSRRRTRPSTVMRRRIRMRRLCLSCRHFRDSWQRARSLKTRWDFLDYRVSSATTSVMVRIPTCWVRPPFDRHASLGARPKRSSLSSSESILRSFRGTGSEFVGRASPWLLVSTLRLLHRSGVRIPRRCGAVVHRQDDPRTPQQRRKTFRRSGLFRVNRSGRHHCQGFRSTNA